MVRANMFVASVAAVFGALAESNGFEELNLLQLRANYTSQIPTHWWRDGGCRMAIDDPTICAFSTDTHMTHRFAGGASNENQRGVNPFLRTKDGSTSIDVFQSPWSTHQGSRQYAKVSAVAMKTGDHLVECSISPDCHGYVYCTVDGKEVKKTTEWPSGLYMSFSSGNVACIDSPDGKVSISIMLSSEQAVQYQQQSKEICGLGVSGKLWLNAHLKVAKDIAVTGDNSLCGGPGSQSITMADSLFTNETSSRMCELSKYRSTNLLQLNESKGSQTPEDCDKFPPPEPADTPEQACENSGCSFDNAKVACGPLQNHSFKYQSCLTDVCAECESEEEQDEIGKEDVKEEEEEEPGAVCIGEDNCSLPTLCSKSVKVDLSSVSQSNLGGIGPDSGEEVIKYSNAIAAGVVGAGAVDVVLKTVSGNYRGNGAANGNSGQFGVVSLKSKYDVELEFSFVDQATGDPVVMDSFSISFFDLDEGKRGKSRTTLTSCDATNVVLTSNTELAMARPNGCFQVSSTTRGSAKNNPTAPDEVTEDQASRSVTLVWGSAHSVRVKFSMSKGAGSRNTLFTLEPTLACMSGEAEDLPLEVPEPIDMEVPSEETCPEFSVARFDNKAIASRQKMGGQKVSDCVDYCMGQHSELNAVQIEVWPEADFAKYTIVDGNSTIPQSGSPWCYCSTNALAAHPTTTYYLMLCPRWKYWCNMNLWQPCLERKKGTSLNGKPWTWKDAL